MSETILNNTPDAPPSNPEAAENQPKRTKTMSEAALAANRANAKKSTGPRTEAGKLKSASNALQHGLYSLSRFEHFIDNNDFALELSSNLIEQFQPITPSEHLLTQQIIHLQLRFLQIESLYNNTMQPGPAAVLDKPPAMLPILLRELNQLPNRIQRAIKALHSEIGRRNQLAQAQATELEIEPISNQEPLPTPPAEVVEAKKKTPGALLFEIFARGILERYPPPPGFLEEENPETNPSEPDKLPEAA